MTSSARWCTVLAISSLLTLALARPDHESQSLGDVFQSQDVAAMFLSTALFSLPVAALASLGERPAPLVRGPGEDASRG